MGASSLARRGQAMASASSSSTLTGLLSPFPTRKSDLRGCASDPPVAQVGVGHAGRRRAERSALDAGRDDPAVIIRRGGVCFADAQACRGKSKTFEAISRRFSAVSGKACLEVSSSSCKVPIMTVGDVRLSANTRPLQAERARLAAAWARLFPKLAGMERRCRGSCSDQP